MNARTAAVPSTVAEARTVAITSVWRVDEAETVIAFLDELRAELWRVHGLEIERRYHEQACRDAALDGQGTLELDDPPF